MTIEEVFEKLNINLNLQSDLLQILHSNEKIEIIGRYLTYKVMILINYILTYI